MIVYFVLHASHAGSESEQKQLRRDHFKDCILQEGIPSADWLDFCRSQLESQELLFGLEKPCVVYMHYATQKPGLHKTLSKPKRERIQERLPSPL